MAEKVGIIVAKCIFSLAWPGLGFDIYLGFPTTFYVIKLKFLAGPFRFSDQRGIVTHLS